MVAVIDDRSEAGGARCLEFKVERSAAEPERIVGSWRLDGGAQGRAVGESRPDSPVEIEFRQVLDCADQHGIPFVWVNDPEELFPYYTRRFW